MTYTDNISNHFTWYEATYLPSWKRNATPADGLTDEVLSNLEALFQKMDQVRTYFNAPIIVHVAYRPESYNEQIGGAKNSAHVQGMACDFHVSGISCDEAKARILKDKKLAEWGMRMENNGNGAGWVHLDTRPIPPGGNVFFTP